MKNNPLTPHYVAYLRDSGGDTQELSIPQQKQAIQNWAAANSAAITHYFIDEARPGSTTIGRDGFLAMIDHFRLGATETGVLIWRMSRFSRDINDAQFYRADLRRRGYTLISINDNIPEGPEAILFEAALDWSNQRFLDDLSRDVKRGLHSLVLNHGCIPGTPPRGFTRTPTNIGMRRDGTPHIAHRWTPDPNLIPIIQQAFQMRATGKTLAQINSATRLFSSLNSYKTFFNNPLYIGELHFADLIIPNYCQPIIDQPTWTTVQNQIQKYHHRNHLPGANPQHPRRVNSPYLLSGLLYCQLCGSPYFGTATAHKDRAPYARYVCTRASRRRDCQAKNISCKPLDQVILQTLAETLKQPTYLAHIQNILQTHQAARQDHLHQQHTQLTAQRANIHRTLTRLANNLETSDLRPRTIIQRISELETAELDIDNQINAIETQLNNPQPILTPKQIDHLSDRIYQTLTTKTDTPALRSILTKLIYRITVTRTDNLITGEIHIYFPPQLNPGPSPPQNDIITRITHAPLGAPPHTPTFPIPFTTSLRPYQRKRPG